MTKPPEVLNFERRTLNILGCSRAEIDYRNGINALLITGAFTLAEFEQIAADYRKLIWDEMREENERLKRENNELRLP